jgi:hypothetical protein
MKHSIKNAQVPGATSDTGWVVVYDRRGITEWHRTIATDRNPSEVAGEIHANGDFPGWTGVEVVKHQTKNGITVLSSTWDSSD